MTNLFVIVCGDAGAGPSKRTLEHVSRRREHADDTNNTNNAMNENAPCFFENAPCRQAKRKAHDYQRPTTTSIVYFSNPFKGQMLLFILLGFREVFSMSLFQLLLFQEDFIHPAITHSTTHS